MDWLFFDYWWILAIGFAAFLLNWLSNPPTEEEELEAYRDHLERGVKLGVIDGFAAADMYATRSAIINNRTEDLDPKAFNKAWQENKQHLPKWEEAFLESLGGTEFGPKIPAEGIIRDREWVHINEVRGLLDYMHEERIAWNAQGWNEYVQKMIASNKDSESNFFKYREDDGGEEAVRMRKHFGGITKMYKAELRPIGKAVLQSRITELTKETIKPPQDMNALVTDLAQRVEAKHGKQTLSEAMCYQYSRTALRDVTRSQLPNLPSGWKWVECIGNNVWKTKQVIEPLGFGPFYESIRR